MVRWVKVGLLFIVLLPFSYFSFVGALYLLNSYLLSSLANQIILPDYLDFISSLILNLVVFLLVLNFNKFSLPATTNEGQNLSKLQYFLLFIIVIFTQFALGVFLWGILFACGLGGNNSCFWIVLLLSYVTVPLVPVLFAFFVQRKTRSFKKAVLFALFILSLEAALYLANMGIGIVSSIQERSQQQKEVATHKVSFEQAVEEIQNCRVTDIVETSPGYIDLFISDGDFKFVDGIDPEKFVAVASDSSNKCGTNIKVITNDGEVLN